MRGSPTPPTTYPTAAQGQIPSNISIRRAASRRRAARLGLAGAMITEYPLEHRRYDQSEYEPFWAAAEALDLPLSLHTATRRQGRIRGAGDKTLRDASSRATRRSIRRLRASSPPHPGHRRVRAGVGAPSALDDGLHLPRAPRRGDLPPRGPLRPLRQPYTGNGETPTIGACPPSISR